MWLLITDTGRRFPLATLPTDLGSDSSAGVRLGDPSVQPRHARFLPGEATGLRVEVCEGAYLEVDGWALAHADLRMGDELLVGTVRLRVAREQASPAPLAAPPARPGAGRSTAVPRPPGRRRPLPVTPRAPVRRGLLHADLGQLPMGVRCLLGLALLLLGAGIVWAVQALVLALG